MIRVEMIEKNGREKNVVTHTFKGPDAGHNLRAHRKADRSLDAAMKGRPYKGVRIQARVTRRSGR